MGSKGLVDFQSRSKLEKSHGNTVSVGELSQPLALTKMDIHSWRGFLQPFMLPPTAV